jgi:hypothetical protein
MVISLAQQPRWGDGAKGYAVLPGFILVIVTQHSKKQ